jgi:hypothetical protein
VDIFSGSRCRKFLPRNARESSQPESNEVNEEGAKFGGVPLGGTGAFLDVVWRVIAFTLFVTFQTD